MVRPPVIPRPFLAAQPSSLTAKTFCHVGREWRVPQEVYSIIETLLPTARGRLLELWAAASPDHCRPGWTHVAEVQRRLGSDGAMVLG